MIFNFAEGSYWGFSMLVYYAEREQDVKCSHSFPLVTSWSHCVFVWPLPFLTTSAQSTDKYWALSLGPALCVANMEERKETHNLVLKEFIVSLGTYVCSYRECWCLWRTGSKHETLSLEWRHKYIKHLNNHARGSEAKCHVRGLQAGSATETEGNPKCGEDGWKTLSRRRETACLKSMSCL